MKGELKIGIINSQQLNGNYNNKSDQFLIILIAFLGVPVGPWWVLSFLIFFIFHQFSIDAILFGHSIFVNH